MTRLFRVYKLLWEKRRTYRETEQFPSPKLRAGIRNHSFGTIWGDGMKGLKIAGYVFLAIAALVAIGAIWIKVRGFRASSEPSAFEATIARELAKFFYPSRRGQQEESLRR